MSRLLNNQAEGGSLIIRYHLIVPSLPGYTFSSKPPLDKDFGMGDIAKVYGNMMKGLGFTAYIAQGSDVGGMVIDYISTLFDECKSTSFIPTSFRRP